MVRLFICLLGILSIPSSLRADPALPADQVIASKAGLTIYQTKVKAVDGGKFGVCIPSTYNPQQPMPLIVSAHGNGQNGETEAARWKDLAQQYWFIVVCPSFLTSHDGAVFPAEVADNLVLMEIMTRVFGSLNIDRNRVLLTGFSGGSLGAWYVGAEHDDWFTALCIRSGNFRYNPPINAAKWQNRPIYIFWGQNDLSFIPGEGQKMVDFVKSTIHPTSFKQEIIPGGTHEGHPDIVAKWFAGLTDADFAPH
jgi:predicted peptidase